MSRMLSSRFATFMALLCAAQAAIAAFRGADLIPSLFLTVGWGVMSALLRIAEAIERREAANAR